MPIVSMLSAVLPLAGGLLHEFVGNFVAGDLVADDEAQAIVGCQITLVVDGKITHRASVGVVFAERLGFR